VENSEESDFPLKKVRKIGPWQVNKMMEEERILSETALTLLGGSASSFVTTFE
jgi:hypothetical protein